jgi:CBS domain-containing protein
MRPIRRILVAAKDPSLDAQPLLETAQLTHAHGDAYESKRMPVLERNMNVGDVCRRDVTTVTADSTLTHAARLLCGGRVEAIVAIASEAKQPTAIGVVTDRDILRAMLERGGDLSGLNVVDILSRNPLVLSRDEAIPNAIAQLQARDVQYAPVIGPGGTLCGATSQRDLLMYRLTTDERLR